ncbi:MAG: hypothetical protein ACFFC7_05745 [Candidatus Hermodarchaeota archaeon]
MAYEDIILGAILGAILSIISTIIVFFLEHFIRNRLEEAEARKRTMKNLLLETRNNLIISKYPDDLKLGFLDEVLSNSMISGDINLLDPQLRDEVMVYRGMVDILNQTKVGAKTTLKKNTIEKMENLITNLEKKLGIEDKEESYVSSHFSSNSSE